MPELRSETFFLCYVIIEIQGEALLLRWLNGHISKFSPTHLSLEFELGTPGKRKREPLIETEKKVLSVHILHSVSFMSN